MRILGKIISSLILIVLLAALAVFGLPRLFGVKMFNVTSGSMTPAYKVGSVVYAFPAKFDEIKVGDVISFMLNADTVATHRVTQIDIENQAFTTKGDANGDPDGKAVSYQNVIGVVRFSLPKIGWTLEYLSTAKGRVMSVAGLIVLILLTAIININIGPGKSKSKSGEGKKIAKRREGQPGTAGVTPPPGWGKKVNPSNNQG
ncbi:MAG: signal peptidase I [Defluviitaleaceae bacterium]|nr:signal peptidase I [Defluviitaleaceae bacterium]